MCVYYFYKLFLTYVLAQLHLWDDKCGYFIVKAICEYKKVRLGGETS